MLNVIVFVCGAALMAVELVATRVLAPALGNSIFVWGSVISVVMLALSLGYWIGGQLADRVSASRVLAPLIAGAGVLTMLAPIVAKAVLPWVANLGPQLGSLAASALIFFLPALLLAMVSPLAVRLASSSGLARIGRSAGGLYAISTGGSIVGTLATSFWLIPLLSLEPLVVWIGFTLFGCSLASLVLPRLYGETGEPEAAAAPAEPARPASRARRIARPSAIAVTIVLALAGALLGAFVLARVAPVSASNGQGERILFRADTQYHRITVTEADMVRHLRFDASNQSAIDLTDGYRSVIAYPNYMDLALALKPDAKRVLVLGLGGGAIAKRWHRDYPGMAIDAVEIDPTVIDVAKRYFGVSEDSLLRIYNQDARRYVQTTAAKYDIVIVDCYYSDSLPFHLTTSEFFAEVRQHMTPDGVMAYNVIGSLDGDDSKVFRSLYRTAAGTWSNLKVFPIGYGTNGFKAQRRNIIVLATDNEIARADLLGAIASHVNGKVRVGGFTGFGRDLYTDLIPVADVPVMTDTYAPIDSLIKVM